jgi:hypothetical protein
MSRVAIIVGVVLSVLGVAAYFGTGRQSMTALIPVAFGLPIAISGVIAAGNEKARMHAMHAAVTLGLLGFLGSVMGLVKFFRMLGGATFERPAAIYTQAAMSAICLVFVILCVRSFIAARRARQAGV